MRSALRGPSIMDEDSDSVSLRCDNAQTVCRVPRVSLVTDSSMGNQGLERASMSSRNSDAGSALVTSKWSRARVQAT